ncbi:7-cyano-7-deazaguanine synthase [Hymenobacter sp. NBH84]|uniref:7-cyano-7-deazaguanine synthase n=1 Tax=Hymenobacter sp. NBH84 TaxID=2596915 RepID=UPI001623A82B|nr:7-cyano-7-deazaguanine synthase [Hymenobacter sp. NBH84]QNE38583.1 7-cyano-7-deazaguanine synthase [Hymenobacter sp. NBH84]
MKSALLLSGGMDSIALAYWKRPAIAITIDYGQLPAKGEIRAATAVAEALGIKHEILRVDCKSLGAGDLTGGVQLDAAPSPEWWPYRNQLLLTMAAMRVIHYDVQELMIGTVASDETHRDGQAPFIELIDHLMAFQERGMHVTAPALNLSCVELVKKSGISRPLLCHAHSCHKSDIMCGECRGCIKYRATMQELYEEEGLRY